MDYIIEIYNLNIIWYAFLNMWYWFFDVTNYHILFIVVCLFKACFLKVFVLFFVAWLLVGMEVSTAIAVTNPAKASLFT